MVWNANKNLCSLEFQLNSFANTILLLHRVKRQVAVLEGTLTFHVSYKNKGKRIKFNGTQNTELYFGISYYSGCNRVQ